MIEIQHKNFREVLKFSLPFTTFVRLEEAWKDWTPRWTFPVPRYNWLFFKCQDAIILWIQRPHSHRSFHVSPIFFMSVFLRVPNANGQVHHRITSWTPWQH
jgi:hypothetical protein